MILKWRLKHDAKVQEAEAKGIRVSEIVANPLNDFYIDM